MRIHLIAKGANSVGQFRTGLNSLQNKINETVNPLQSVNNKFDGLTGGLGNLYSAKGNIVERIQAEEAKREAVRQTANNTDEFIRNTVDTDNRVATNVSDSQREFIEKYTWLRPANVNVNSESWFNKLIDWLGDIFTTIHEKLSLAWESLKKISRKKHGMSGSTQPLVWANGLLAL